MKGENDMNGGFYDFNGGYNYAAAYEQNLISKKKIKSHSTRVGLCVLFFLHAPLLAGLIMGATGTYDAYSESLSLQYCIEMILMVFFLFVPFFLLYVTTDKKDKGRIAASLEKPKSPLLFILSVPMGLMLCFAGDYVSSIVSSLFAEIGITLTSVPEYEIPTKGVPLFLFAFSTIVPPAVIEEFALRSVAMQPLRKYGDRFAIVMTALVFGLMHRNAVQGIFAFIAGLVFGYIAVATNSVWPAVIVHAVNNSFSVLISVLNETMGDAVNQVYSLIVSVVMVAGIFATALFFFFAKRNKLKNPLPSLPVKEKVKSFLLNIPMIISMIIMAVYTIFGDL